MSMREYIGMRYVPLFADPLEWDNTRTYEPLTVVLYQGASYTSRQAVPVGIDIANTEFWALTGNYNAQVEQYRLEVQHFDGRITQAQGDATSAKNTAESATSAIGSGFDENHTVADAITALNEAVGPVPEGQTVENQISELNNKVGTVPEGTNISEEISTLNMASSKYSTILAGFDGDTPTDAKEYVDTADTNLANSLSNFKNTLSRKLTPLSDVFFDVLSRHFTPEPLHGVQGFCVFESNGVRYWAQSEFINDTSTAELAIYNLDSHEKVGGVQGVFGHMHGMRWIDDRIYIDGSTTGGTNARYSIVDVSVPSSPYIVQALTSLPVTTMRSRICFKSPTECFHIGTVSGTVYLYDLSASTDTPYVQLNGLDLGHSTVQDFNYCAELELFTVTTTSADQVFIFDATTGERLNVIHVPSIILHTKHGEIEGAQIDAVNGKLYVNAAESVYGVMLADLYEWDFLRGSVDQSYFIRAAHAGNDQFLQCNVNGNTGDLVHPTQHGFLLVSDILNLMRYQKNEAQIRVHITSAEYAYPILLQDANVWLTAPSSGCVMHSIVRQIGGELVFSNASSFTFDGANTSDTYAVRCTGGRLSIGKPTIAGSITGEFYAENDSQVFNTAGSTFTNAVLVRSIGFLKNTTNLTLTTSPVYTW